MLLVSIFVSSSGSKMPENILLLRSVANRAFKSLTSFSTTSPTSKLFPKNTNICFTMFFPINLFTLNIGGDNNDIIYN